MAATIDYGEAIKGPSAFSGGFRRSFTLASAIARTDFKLRFFGSALGYLWQLMRPLMLFGVLYLVFTKIVHVSTGNHYPVALLLGIVLFTFFAEATSASVTSVMDRENMVRKIHFPRMVIPVAVVMLASFNLTLNLGVVFVFAFISGVSPSWTWLGLLPLLAILVVFASGVAMLLSALYIRYRDVKPIWEVVLQVTFYASLVLIPYETIRTSHPHIASALVCNPLAAVLQEARHVVVDPAWVSASSALGGATRLLVPAAITVGTFLLGLWVFNREAPRIAEEL
ncbi:MAG TPA: ABC transporter permease [Solirubrobacteraceae bacterium]|nr:ABC transporter permease [Solirubrobacteraceae bacterium]